MPEFSRRMFLGAGAGVLAQAQAAAPSDKITVGMIAVGSRAQELLEAIKQVPGTEIVGVCDAYSGRIERAVERTEGRAKVYKSYKGILADPSIDAVTVATPDHWHKKMVIEALEAGKDVYCEKPLTYTVDDGIEIAAAVKRTGKLVQVGSQGISGDNQQKVRDWVKGGKLGQVTMIRASYNRNSASGAWIYPIPPDASEKTVNWDAFLGSATPRDFDLERFFRWRCYKEYSGGIATDLFVHLCTTIHFVMGATMPSEVMAMGDLYRWKESRDVPDTLNAVLRYPEGFTVNMSSTFNSRGDGGAGFQFLGTEGAVQLGAVGAEFTPENMRENNDWIVAGWPSKLEAAYYETPEGRAEKAKAVRRSPEKFKGRPINATVLHFQKFFNSVRTREATVEDEWAGHHAAACAHLVNESSRRREVVKWNYGTHRQA
jgi:predicted dehydrogenase